MIRKRYQTNELAVDSTELGTRGSEVPQAAHWISVEAKFRISSIWVLLGLV